MENIIIIFLLSLYPVHGQDFGDCECIPGGQCASQPYGSSALDLSVLGIFPPCSSHGYVRCCSRKGLESVYAGMLKAAVNQQPAVNIRPVDIPSASQLVHDHSNDECGCIPAGLCRSGITRQTSDCSGHLELCCIHGVSQNDFLVNLFSQNEVSNTPEAPTRAPVFRPSPVFSPSKQQEKPINVAKSIEEPTQQDVEGLPCLPAVQCSKVYGYDPLDIAKYGVLSPCAKRGLHRCVEPKNRGSLVQPQRKTTVTTTTRRTTITTTTTTTARTIFTTTSAYEFDGRVGVQAVQKMRIVPCIPVSLCKGTAYNPSDSGHLARFGVLPRCRQAMSRCIMEVDIGLDSGQPKVNLPFFSNKVMQENFDLPVFTEDKFRETMFRFFGTGRNNQRSLPTTTARPTTLQPTQSNINRNPPDLHENFRLFLAQLASNSRSKPEINNPSPVNVETPTLASRSSINRNQNNFSNFPQGLSKNFQNNPQNNGKEVPPTPRSKISALLQLQNFLNTNNNDDNIQTNEAQVVKPNRNANNVQTNEAQVVKPNRHIEVLKKELKIPGGSKRVVPFNKIDLRKKKIETKSQPKSASKDPKNPTLQEKRSRLRSFFAQRKRPNLFKTIRKEENEAFGDIAPSVEEDGAGNVVISGGTKVFHLHPGIAPQVQRQQRQHQQQQQQQQQQQKQQQQEARQPSQNFAAVSQNLPLPEESQNGQDSTVFFNPIDAPKVAQVLKNSKSSIIQFQTDDDQKMVLNVQNDQLLGILEALQLALDKL